MFHRENTMQTTTRKSVKFRIENGTLILRFPPKKNGTVRVEFASEDVMMTTMAQDQVDYILPGNFTEMGKIKKVEMIYD